MKEAKLIVSSTYLWKKLKVAGMVIGSNSVLPILSMFHFELNENNVLKVTATNLETYTSFKAEVESLGTGSACVKAKEILGILKLLPDQPITLTLKNEGIDIMTDCGKYEFSGDLSDDFPSTPKTESSYQHIEIDRSTLKQGINRTSFAMSKDELRPSMTGMYYAQIDNKIIFVATDAHILSKQTFESKTKNDFKMILLAGVLEVIDTILKGPIEPQNVKIDLCKSYAFIYWNDFIIITRLIDAKYPDYNAVIPLTADKTLTVERVDLIQAFKRLNILAKNTTHQVIMKATTTEVVLNVEDKDFGRKAMERVPCQYEGEDIEIGLNARYLILMLENMESQEILIRMSGPLQAITLIPSEATKDQESIYLIMPLQLND